MSKGRHRTVAADIARSVRRMWPDLEGEWTRRDWNNRARYMAHNYMARMERKDRNAAMADWEDAGRAMPSGRDY